MHPNYTALLTDAFNIHFSSAFGIPVTLATYSSTVIPVILMSIALKYIDGFFDKVIPKIVKFFFKPVLTLLAVGMLTFIVLGPIGFVVGVWNQYSAEYFKHPCRMAGAGNHRRCIPIDGNYGNALWNRTVYASVYCISRV